jgi:hypothetical protein
MAYHCYADDTQIYQVIKPLDNWDDISDRLEACLSDIKSWMCTNMLKLNQDKTELIGFAPKHKVKSLTKLQFNFDGAILSESSCVRNLGVFFDQTLSMEQNASAITKSCFHQIRNIGRIRSYITVDVCKTLVCSLVTSRMFYSNALMYGVNASIVSKLQCVQNTAARLVTRKKKYEHITPTLVTLHWLPFKFRCQYKLLLYVFKALHGLAPSYLGELIHFYKPARSLRSQSAALIEMPKNARTKIYGERRFDVASGTLWNSLPASLRNEQSLEAFKKGLKTHLFEIAFVK